MELEIIKAIQSIGNNGLDIFCKSISYLASYLGFFFWLVIIFVFFKKSFACVFGVTYGISVGLNYIIKAVVNRPRPYVIDATIINKLQAVGQSFPSGHTLSATIICVFLSYWINEKVKNKLLKIILNLVLVVFVISVIFSRMYCTNCIRCASAQSSRGIYRRTTLPCRCVHVMVNFSRRCDTDNSS